MYNSILTLGEKFNFDQMKYIIEIGPGAGSLSRLIKSQYIKQIFL